MDDRGGWDLEPDSVDRALQFLMPRSAGALVREAFYGTRRFEDFVTRTGLTRSGVAQQLRSLVAKELLAQVSYQEPGERRRQEYELTERGVDLVPAVIALMAWADRWLPTDRGPTVRVEHVACGESVTAVVSCAAGHHTLAPGELRTVPGPGAHRA